jgi:hypothetical protein
MLSICILQVGKRPPRKRADRKKKKKKRLPKVRIIMMKAAAALVTETATFEIRTVIIVSSAC